MFIDRQQVAKAVSGLTLMALLSGCGLVNLSSLLPSTTASGSTIPDYTGNYAIIGTPSTSGIVPTPVSALYGAIANTGASFTGTFRLVTTNLCIPATQDVTFTGSRDSGGTVTLASTNLPANSIAITLLSNPATSGAGIGSYTITGAGACAMPTTNFASDLFTPLTGTYSGGIYSPSTSLLPTATATVTQASSANSDGQYVETGTLTIPSSSCTITFKFSGIVTGPTISGTLTQSTTGVPITAALAGTVTASASQIVITPGLAVAGTCNAGLFTGTLNKQ